MLLKIAWRNVWRSRNRSLVVIGAIVVGIAAILFGNGTMNGFLVGYMADAINYDVSNIQVHHPEFRNDFDVHLTIPDGRDKALDMQDWTGVKATATRTLVNGMIASSRKAAGIQIRGIDPEAEARVTLLDSIIAEGEYFTNVKRNPVIIGQKLAENLQVSVRSKVVLTFNDGNGDITTAAFRVAGIVKSSNLKINEGYAYVKQSDLLRILEIGDGVHEIGVLLERGMEEQPVLEKYNSTFSGDLIETWREISPELAFMQESYGSVLIILLVIIMLALVFGIVNTMLMAVLERVRELGMLMAIGMSKVRIFFMIIIETVYLSLVGAPIGLLLGYLIINYLERNGVDLTNYSEGLEAYGYSSILYPYLDNEVYWIVTFAVVLTAILGALYPAWKAVRLNPVEALHKI